MLSHSKFFAQRTREIIIVNMHVIASFLSALLVALPSLPDPLTTPLTFPQMSSTTLPAVEGTTNVPVGTVTTSGTKLVATRHIHDNLYEIDVYSASMDRVITNNLLLPPGGPDNTTPRPTFYLMQGSYGGERGDTWATASDYESLFRGKTSTSSHPSVATARSSMTGRARPRPWAPRSG
ncbi:hypothetical protein HMPREF2976_08890 [Corynebacterium sp. HMSC077D10]|nr:hypothetical protein HMPREF0307_01516 [Corynebacterium sp. DNF00584]OFL79024.1 hypothetical protein HMPREF2748_00345 [Corynebacterium sp. HMSC077B05]OFP18939.1 hypothetical protein HMPREF2998_11050 [Corynebacterium sp. HMSC065A05]OFP68110.1 hypothetical protein HMPREF2976_08890 [Corynebacterium sp. HMSC077D10]